MIQSPNRSVSAFTTKQSLTRIQSEQKNQTNQQNRGHNEKPGQAQSRTRDHVTSLSSPSDTDASRLVKAESQVGLMIQLPDRHQAGRWGWSGAET